jgi:hypothetical protein
MHKDQKSLHHLLSFLHQNQRQFHVPQSLHLSVKHLLLQQMEVHDGKEQIRKEQLLQGLRLFLQAPEPEAAFSYF